MGKVEYAMLIEPMPGETQSGDKVWCAKFNNHILFCLIDVAGHGDLASELGEESLYLVEQYKNHPLDDIIVKLNEFLKGKRGLVIGLALIDIQTGLVQYMGIGNIRARIIGKQSYRFVSRTGMLGVSKSHPILENYFLNDKDIFLMYSDGVSDQFEKKDYPSITEDLIEKIPVEILSIFNKKTDDASCIAVRYFYDNVI